MSSVSRKGTPQFEGVPHRNLVGVKQKIVREVHAQIHAAHGLDRRHFLQVVHHVAVCNTGLKGLVVGVGKGIRSQLLNHTAIEQTVTLDETFDAIWLYQCVQTTAYFIGQVHLGHKAHHTPQLFREGVHEILWVVARIPSPRLVYTLAGKRHFVAGIVNGLAQEVNREYRRGTVWLFHHLNEFFEVGEEVFGFQDYLVVLGA